jgi:hypothetical protein
MQVTGELTSGAIAIVITLLTLGGGWLLTTARQNTRFDLMIAALQVDIKQNREAYTSALIEIRADLKGQDKSIDEVKLQLAAMSSQQNIGSLFATLPEAMARAVSQAVRETRRRDMERDAA